MDCSIFIKGARKMIFMLVTLVPCLLVGFGLGAGFGYKMGEQDEKKRIDQILKKRNRRYEER
jgi:hypothetical protein